MAKKVKVRVIVDFEVEEYKGCPTANEQLKQVEECIGSMFINDTSSLEGCWVITDVKASIK